MATGDTQDFARRLRAVLPDRWCEGDVPVLDALLAGLGAGWAAVWVQLKVVQLQTRLLTVQGPFLDLAAQDFKGFSFVRRANETDDQFRGRALPIFRDKVTREAVLNRLAQLTGRPCAMFEPARPADTGGYDTGAMGYDMGGTIWGALDMPCQAFVIAFRPSGAGLPNVAGYDTGVAGYMPGGGGTAWSSLDDELPHVTDADIYAAIADTMGAGSVAWTTILS